MTQVDQASLSVPNRNNWVEVHLDSDGGLSMLKFPPSVGGVGELPIPKAGAPVTVEYIHGDDADALAANLKWFVGARASETTIKVRLWGGQQWLDTLLTLQRNRSTDGEGPVTIAFESLVEGRQLRAMLEGSLQAILVHRDGVPLYANPGYVRLLGYADIDAIMRQNNVLEQVHPDDREMVTRRAARRVAGGVAPEHYEFRVLRLDGRAIWLDCLASVVEWEGQPAVLAAFYDITARKQAEEAQTHSQNLFMTVFQTSPDIMILTDVEDYRIVDVNQTFTEHHGISREQAIGQPIGSLDINIDRRFRDEMCTGLSRQRAVRDLMTSLVTHAGEKREYAVSAQVIGVEDQELLLLVARDVTERRRHEAELRRSKEAAERANQSKSTFLANMSHELRTPLNAIIGFSEVIRNEMLGPIELQKYVEYAGDINSSGQHLLEIINDLLDLSKLEAGRLELHEEDISLADIATAGMALVRGRADDVDVRLYGDVPDSLPRVHADARAIKQVLINLLSNAVKFTPAGGRVELVGYRLDGGGLAMQVRDTGIGMSAEDIALAFKPFGQVDSIYTRDHQGTGLGLPLARSLMQLHGGDITVESTIGEGTLVTIILPPSRVRSTAA